MRWPLSSHCTTALSPDVIVKFCRHFVYVQWKVGSLNQELARQYKRNKPSAQGRQLRSNIKMRKTLRTNTETGTTLWPTSHLYYKYKRHTFQYVNVPHLNAGSTFIRSFFNSWDGQILDAFSQVRNCKYLENSLIPFPNLKPATIQWFS